MVQAGRDKGSVAILKTNRPNSIHAARLWFFVALFLMSPPLGRRLPAAPIEPHGSSDEKAPAKTLRLEDQREIVLNELDLSHGACLFFIGTDCPISNAYAPEIERIIRAYEKEKIAFHIVYVVRDLTPKEASEHAKAYGYRGSLFIDSKLAWAKELGVTHMPEVVVLSPAGKAIYQGRIDDRYPAPGGKRREHPTSHDLKDALTAFLNGTSISNPKTKPIGCPLDFRK